MNSKVNISFLLKNNLVKVSLLGIAFWLVIFLCVTFDIKQPIGFYPLLLLFLNYIFFFIGLKIITTTKKEKRLTYTIKPSVIQKLFYIIIIIALLGFFLKILDKFYLRGASFSYSISYNRILLQKSGASIVSILSAVITPFSFLPLFLYYMLPKKKWYFFLISISLFFSASFDFLMMGSRSGMFVIIILLFLYLQYHRKLKITPLKTIIIALVVFYLGIFSVKLFIERTKDFAITDKNAIEHILKRSAYNFTISPTQESKKKIIYSKNKDIQATRLAIINFAQYYLHGLFEFGYLYQNYDSSYNYGAYTFNVFVKFVNIIFRTNIINQQKTLKSPPRIGVYTTFFGPIFLDFGWLSFVFMFFLGTIQKTIYNKCLEGRFQFIPLLFYFLIINFFMPVFNFISGAQGLYNIICFFIFVLLYQILVGKLFINQTQFVKILK